ncbi:MULTISPECIES: formylglycine-generating enzyme family protein [unclassified Microcystis]|jgi:formylglycine-generating enzyme required for sulfatase activity|uniref:Formylglycine-generating enzyme family protein n=1 Tax=Microcystis flos-aquae Mf_QC_C_20070823_S10D TaxID=2486236 RepID=A0A552KHT4_9CHRO|nr:MULTISPECIES: formylglycine-generating enzyme family protein [unclassified Microcystis]MCA2816038.1 formylglycine-generating enzyme family protein [Microcystis sp. M085S1]MCA2856878.1 formylglycine-generating enzyme family protein [Microcystis sp. M065S1]TRT78832.1 MAG: formylglycine-generating enzyme family protein [Microcystis flos-aquae Ma_QC_C_20070823_S18]TRU03293.1 MAG: formylglycine-generating enzyme family protein [Microcystis flos-aquae Ma_QC_C_20070823_S18D]TRV07554.1 MAG: formylg
MEGKKAIWWEDEREMAELIWCAAYLDRIIAPWSMEQSEQSEATSSNDKEDNRSSGSGEKTPPPGAIESTLPVAYPENIDRPMQTSQKRDSVESDRSSPVRVPDPFPIPEPTAISKAILPLARRVPGLRADELDIEVTVERTAEAGGLPMLAFRPPLERWLEVHLLIDRSPPMEFWGDLAGGMTTLFRWQGFFRDVRVWWFETGENEARLLSGAGQIERNPRSLVAPSGNRLFIVLTDTLGKAWRSGSAFATLADLGKEHPVTIAHIFPQELWQRTALEGAILRPLIAPGPASANAILQVGERLRTKQILYRFPIFNLSPAHFATWAKFIAGSGGNSIQGVLMGAKTAGVNMGETGEEEAAAPEAESPEELLRGFLIDASPLARELAKVLAAVPLIPPVMRLAQRRFLPDSKHWHLAEVFFSGLVEKSTFSPEGATVPDAWYDFYPGIRQLLLADSANRRTIDIWRGIGDYIRDHYGEFRDFSALIPNPQGSLADAVSDRSLYFAEVDAAVLRTWGGEYADIAQNIEERVRQRKQEILTPEKLLKFPFETIYVNKRGEITKREPLEAYYYQEPLGEGIEPLTMVAIPGGTFLMGSPPNEKDSFKDERPEHEVTVSNFFMGKYPITQAQWKAIASRTDLKVEKDLDLNPAYFKDRPDSDRRPVEQVNWDHAIEFCARLSKLTGREYRLPSEAEWEYACRAGTTTPFYFGETITGELANYNASRIYAEEPKGEYRQQTTPVGQFHPNAFGLYDMHGNVREWCADTWHDNYDGAPTDGSPWIENGNDNRSPLRGGSWGFNPTFCRSAIRNYFDRRDYRDNDYGFRVVCVFGRTL